jgi:hypothetical protein
VVPLGPPAGLGGSNSLDETSYWNFLAGRAGLVSWPEVDGSSRPGDDGPVNPGSVVGEAGDMDSSSRLDESRFGVRSN